MYRLFVIFAMVFLFQSSQFVHSRSIRSRSSVQHFEPEDSPKSMQGTDSLFTENDGMLQERRKREIDPAIESQDVNERTERKIVKQNPGEPPKSSKQLNQGYFDAKKNAGR